MLMLKLYLSVPFHLIELKVCIKVICKVYINWQSTDVTNMFPSLAKSLMIPVFYVHLFKQMASIFAYYNLHWLFMLCVTFAHFQGHEIWICNKVYFPQWMWISECLFFF